MGIFSGHVWAHHCCAAWSEGVVQSCNLLLLYVDKAVFGGISQVNHIMVSIVIKINVTLM